MLLNHRDIWGQRKGPEASEAQLNSLNNFFLGEKSGALEVLKACVDAYKFLPLPIQCGQQTELPSAS